MKEARFWNHDGDNKVKCGLCPHNCVIKEGQRGLCRIRLNQNGILYAGGYGEIVTVAVDPIEKKPLYHFYPGSDILSVGANGCNLTCGFCQNWQVSQQDRPTKYFHPEELVAVAKENNSFAIAYTYTEPLIWFEYISDCVEVSKKEGIKTVLVTNGFLSEEPMMELVPKVDAMNIDLKAIKPEFYKKICGGSLAPVLKFIEYSAKHTHIELTNLIIPTLNDSDDDLDKISSWVASINRSIPVHFSAYYPQYKIKIDRTPPDTLYKAYEIAKKHLDYVYLGNIISKYGSDTCCHSCGNLLIERDGYNARIKGLDKNRCVKCKSEIPIIC